MNRPLLFRIFYNGFFSILCLILLGLLIVTPADAIRQALHNRQIYNVFVIAGCYFLTIFLATLIYASRLYTTRSVLAAIPKTWIPVEKGDVKERVRKMISDGLKRSAWIAWNARPRTPEETEAVLEPITRQSSDNSTTKEKEPRRYCFSQRSRTRKDVEENLVAILPHVPTWGDISHNGWSSPSSDPKNLQYITVILELPHVIEAKAVSLAPPDPQSNSDPPLPDIRAVELLQRPAMMGLRDYITYLMSIDVITDTPTANRFLSQYEYARFSSQPISGQAFHDLMNEFTKLLRNMKMLDPSYLVPGEEDLTSESDTTEDTLSASSSITPRTRSIASTRNGINRTRSNSQGTIRTWRSRGSSTNGAVSLRHSAFTTAPGTPRYRSRGISSSSSANSFAQSWRRYADTSSSASDGASLRSSNQGSVIRLNTSDDDTELPYTLTNVS
ncbi:hypothetical protein F5884DRAFT_762357 [Xylogone sp. PMI_703]|nr:hypothetical protein F5884DRAFT_762357 [Xylogone sp. PMI_703]